MRDPVDYTPEEETAAADQAADAYERMLRRDGTPNYRLHTGRRPTPAPPKDPRHD